MNIKLLEKLMIINIFINSIATILWIISFRFSSIAWCQDFDQKILPYFITNDIVLCNNFELFISTIIYQSFIGISLFVNCVFVTPKVFPDTAMLKKYKYIFIFFVTIIFVFWIFGKIETFLYFNSAKNGGFFGPIIAASSLYLATVLGQMMALIKSTS